MKYESPRDVRPPFGPARTNPQVRLFYSDSNGRHAVVCGSYAFASYGFLRQSLKKNASVERRYFARNSE
jgi:hypothetical protein